MRELKYNIKALFSFVFIAIAINSASCAKSKDPYYLMWENVMLTNEGHFETLKSIHGTYNSEVGLLCRSIEKNDIRARINYEDYITLDFFNYDDEIWINDYRIPNVFLSSISKNIILSNIAPEEISIVEMKNSSKFGDYGIANVQLNNSQTTVRGVIVTPLSIKFLNSGKLNNEGSLVFVRFDNEDSYKDYIFYGDDVIEYIINNRYHKIEGTITPNIIYPPTGTNWNYK